MGTTYTGLRVQDSYNAIIKIGDNSNLTGIPKIISDALGNDSPLYLSTSKLGVGVSPTFQFQTSSNAKIGGNLTVAGNLTVNGTTTIVDSTIVAIGDNMIEMAKDNVSNTMDIGWYGTLVESGTKYVGVYYDASSGVTTPEFHIGLGTVEPGSTAAWTVKGKLVIGDLSANGGDFTDTVYIDDHLEIENSSGYGYIEVGGSDGGYIDLKGPFSDDFDLRLFTGGTNSQINAISGTLDITANSGIDLQYNGTTILEIKSTGVDVTGDLFVSGGFKDSDGDYGTSDQVLSSTGTGTDWIDNYPDKTRSIRIVVKNTETFALFKGTVVHAHPSASPPSGNVIEVKAADYDTASLMPAIGILAEDLDAAGGTNDEGEAVMIGFLNGVNTVIYSEGDELYVGNGGGLTNTKPTATNQLIQKIAVVIKSDTTAGSLEIFGAGRSNDVPNLIERSVAFDGGNLSFGDDDKIIFGDNQDLNIQSNGVNTFLSNLNNNLIIQNSADDSDIVFKSDNGDGTSVSDYLVIDGSAGSVNLYHYGSLKFYTTTDGVTLTEDMHFESSAPIISATANNNSSGLRINVTSQTTGQLFRVQESGSTLFEIDHQGLTKITEELNVLGTGESSFAGDVTIASQLEVGASGSTDTPTIKATSASTAANILLEGTDTTASSAPDLVLYRNAGAIADNDTLGVLEFRGRDNLNSGDISYGAIFSRIIDASNQHSAITFSTYYGSTFTNGGLSLHSVGTNTPRCLIGNTDPFAIPTDTLDVDGTANISGNTIIGGNLTFGAVNPFQQTVNVLDGTGTDGARIRSAVSTAANPTFSNSDDTDTGMFFPSANSVALSTGGTQALLIDSDGNVGIGIESPVSKIHVYQDDTSTSTTTGVTIEQDGTGDAQLQFLLTGVQRWVAGIDNSDSDKFKIGRGSNWATGQDIVIDTSGNVGIGQTSIPSTVLLDLKEPDSGSDLIIGLTAGTGARAQIRSEAQSTNYEAELSFYTVTGNVAGERMKIDSSGTTMITKTQVTGSFDTTSFLRLHPSTTVNSGGFTNIFFGTSFLDNYGISLGGLRDGTDGTPTFIIKTHYNDGTGSEKMRITAGGNVGINETDPTAGLHVSSAGILGSNSTNPIAFTGSGSSNAGIGSYNANTDMNIYSAGTGDIKFRTGAAWNSSAALTSTGSTRMLIKSNGDIDIAKTSTRVVNLSNVAMAVGSAATGAQIRFQPQSDNAVDLGSSGNRWDDVYATNGTINTSDRNEKNTIKDTDLGLDFINKLKPVSYIWNNKTRTHYGLIAQDVEEVLEDISKDTKDFAGFIKEDISEEKDNSKLSYGLRYNEFIAPMIKAIQEQQDIINDLKSRIETLEN